MKRQRKIWGVLFAMMLVLLVSAIPASAASLTSAQKKTAKATDSFVAVVLVETGAKNSNYKRSHSAFIKKSKSYYNGTLGEKQKSAMATLNVNPYKYYEYMGSQIGVCRAASVKSKYKALFGKTPSTIMLPTVRNKYTGKYYLTCAKSGSVIYSEFYETESDVLVPSRTVSKSGSTYTVTEKVKYWHYWGDHSSGKTADQTVTVKIKMKKNSSSSYGYKITGLKIS